MTRRRLWFGGYLLCLTWAGVAFSLMVQQSWWFVPMFLGAFICAAICVIGKDIHEHRQGTRDRDDSRPDPGAGHDAVRAIPTGALGAATAGPRLIDEPLRGWKHAGLMRTRDGLIRFAGYGMPYGVEAVAVCGSAHDHRAPDPSCTCGFYAWRTDHDPGYAYGTVRLELELYGSVICAEHGYRAEKIRVLGASMKRGDLTPKCRLHPDMVMLSAFGEREDYSPYATFVTSDGRYVCAQHALEGRARFYEYVAPRPDDVVRDLPTDWKWL